MGVGTRMEYPSTFPCNSGSTKPTAFAAPVGGGDDVEGGCAGAARIFVSQVENALVALCRNAL